jgi:hypothetical protein
MSLRFEPADLAHRNWQKPPLPKARVHCPQSCRSGFSVTASGVADASVGALPANRKRNRHLVGLASIIAGIVGFKATERDEFA